MNATSRPNVLLAILMSFAVLAGVGASGVFALRAWRWGDANDLHRASYLRDISGLKGAIDGGASIDASCRMRKDSRVDQSTALMIAAMQDFPAGVAELLSRKPDLRARDRFGFMAIHHAAMSGGAEVVELILACDPSLVDTPSSGGLTPLMHAAQRGDVEVVKVFLKYGANAGAVGNDGWDCVRYATVSKDDAIIKLIQERAATGRPVVESPAAPAVAPEVAQCFEVELVELVDISRVQKHDDPDIQARLDGRDPNRRSDWAIKVRLRGTLPGANVVVDDDSLFTLLHYDLFLIDANGEALRFATAIHFHGDGMVSPTTSYSNEWRTETRVLYSMRLEKDVREVEAVGYRFDGSVDIRDATGKKSRVTINCEGKFRAPITVKSPPRRGR